MAVLSCQTCKSRMLKIQTDAFSFIEPLVVQAVASLTEFSLKSNYVEWRQSILPFLNNFSSYCKFVFKKGWFFNSSRASVAIA